MFLEVMMLVKEVTWVRKFKKGENMIDTKEIIIKSKNMEQDLIEKGFKEDDIIFFISLDIQLAFESFINEALKITLHDKTDKFMDHTFYTIEGKETMYIGIKI